MNAITSSGKKVETMFSYVVPPFQSAPIHDDRDCSTREGADALAAMIRSVWMKAGYEVDVWVDEAVNLHNGTFAFCIRSDLFNGLPRRRLAASSKGVR